jgi:hypothetical protein
LKAWQHKQTGKWTVVRVQELIKISYGEVAVATLQNEKSWQHM